MSTQRESGKVVMHLFQRTCVGDQAAEAILSFRKLKDGWHYGAGHPAAEQSTETALRVLQLFRDEGASSVEVFPEQDGGILVSGYRGDHAIDVLCMSDRQLDLIHEVGGKELADERDLSLDDVASYLKGVGWQLQRSYALSIRSTTARNKGGLKVSRSGTHPGAGFQLLTADAPNTLADRYASTSNASTIQGFPAIRRSSGELALYHSRQVVD